MIPPAAGRASTTTACPQSSVIFSPVIRARLSGPGPTMTRSGLSGKFCAKEILEIKHKSKVTFLMRK